MNISQALKLKNRLAGEITRLKDRMISCNSRKEGENKTYDAMSVLTEVLRRIDDIATVKGSISLANAGIQGEGFSGTDNPGPKDIFLMAEFRGLISSLRQMSCKEGTYLESVGYSSESSTIQYKCDISQSKADSAIKDLERQINDIQDSLDRFNATTEIPGLDNIKI
jgi:hypothetical protein